MLRARKVTTVTIPRAPIVALNDRQIKEFLYLRTRSEVQASVERSTDFQAWTSGTDVTYVGETHLLDGTAEVTWRSVHPIGDTPTEFLRLKITKP